MKTKKLAVKVGQYTMNRHCRDINRHKPSESKDCPYCDICEHGRTAFAHCDECNTNKSWLDKPITKAEVREVLRQFSGLGLWIMRQSPKRYYGAGVQLAPLALRYLHNLVDKA